VVGEGQDTINAHKNYETCAFEKAYKIVCLTINGVFAFPLFGLQSSLLLLVVTVG